MNDSTAGTEATAVRASDAERDQAVALLQRHFADGRLTLAELEERSATAYTARTLAQLRGLTADLPADPGRQSAPAGHVPRPLPALPAAVPVSPGGPGLLAALPPQPAGRGSTGRPRPRSGPP